MAALNHQKQGDRSYNGQHRQSNVHNGLTDNGQHKQSEYNGGMIHMDLFPGMKQIRSLMNSCLMCISRKVLKQMKDEIGP